MKRDFQARFPRWSAVQASVLSSAPASAEPERVFSLTASIKSLRRNRLSPAVLEALVLLKSDGTMDDGDRRGVVRPATSWYQRVAMAILVLNGHSRKQARAKARSLQPTVTPKTFAASLSTKLGPHVEITATPSAADKTETVRPSFSVLIPREDLDDEEDDDEGDVMEKLVEAGAKVADDGSLILDADTIVVLESDAAAAAGVGGVDDDQDRLQDQGARDAAAQLLWDTVERRSSTRLASKPRVTWHHV